MSIFLDALRGITGQAAAVPAMRALILTFALVGCVAWIRRRPFLSVSCLWLGGLVGLGFRLLPIVSPLGLGTDPEVSRSWAQAGVNALAEPSGEGFVWGTMSAGSFLATLASAGIPLDLVHVAPQFFVLLGLTVLALLPFGHFQNRTTGAFAAALTLSGGGWPGALPYGAMLRWPFSIVIIIGLFGLGKIERIRPIFHRHRLHSASLAIGASSLAQAFSGDGESSFLAALFLGVAGLCLASPTRALLRRTLASAWAARRVEALTLLCVFAGGGVFWWDPARTIPGYDEATDANEALLRPMAWIRENVPRKSVIVASPEYSAAVAALGGRRVLLPPATTEPNPPLPEPFRRARLFDSARQGRPIARLAEAFSATHLFLGPGEQNPADGEEPAPTGELRLHLALVYQDAKDFRIFQFVKK